MMCNEQAYSIAVEKLLNIEVPLRAKYIRSKCSNIVFYEMIIKCLIKISGYTVKGQMITVLLKML